MSGRQPCTIRLSPSAAKALTALPEHAQQTGWDILDAVAANPWGFAQWDTGDAGG